MRSSRPLRNCRSGGEPEESVMYREFQVPSMQLPEAVLALDPLYLQGMLKDEGGIPNRG
jgi:hypothetical protein